MVDAPSQDTSSSSGAGRLLAGSATVTFSTLVMVLAQFAVMLVISHRLGDEGMGLVSLTVRTISFPLMIAELGLPSIVTQMAASQNSSSVRMPILPAALLPSSIISLLGFVLVIIIAGPVSQTVGSADIAFLLILQGVIVPVSTIGTMASCFLRGRMQFGRYGVTLALAPVIGLSLVIIWLFVLTPFLAVLAGVLVALVGTVIALALTTRDAWARPSLGLSLRLLQASLPLLVAGFAGSIIDSIGVMALGFLSYGLGDVGSFSNAFSIASYLRYLVEPMSLVLLPVSAAALARGALSEVESVVRTGVRFIVALFVPFAFICAVLSSDIIILLLPFQFLTGSVSLTILALATPGLALYYLFSRLLIAAGKSALAGTLLIVFAAVDISLTVVLTYQYGMIGAATSSALTFVLMGAVTTRLASRQLGISTGLTVSDVLRAGLALAIYLIARHVIATSLSGAGVYSALLVAVGVLGVALVLEALLKPLSTSETSLILQVLENSSSLGPLYRPVRRVLMVFTQKEREPSHATSDA